MRCECLIRPAKRYFLLFGLFVRLAYEVGVRGAQMSQLPGLALLWQPFQFPARGHRINLVFRGTTFD